jgi:hypothetical protein
LLQKHLKWEFARKSALQLLFKQLQPRPGGLEAAHPDAVAVKALKIGTFAGSDFAIAVKATAAPSPVPAGRI